MLLPTQHLQQSRVLFRPRNVVPTNADVVRAVVFDRTSGHTVFSRKPGKSYMELGISGWIEAGESPRATAARELVEELGIQCSSFEYLAKYHASGRNGCMLRIVALLATVIERCPLIVGNELEMAKWAALARGYNDLSLPEHLALLHMISYRRDVNPA